MSALFQDVRFALRGLARHPGFTTIAVATLALGVGSSTAMFSVIDAALLRPLPFPDPDRILRLEERHEDGASLNLTGAAFRALRERNRSFSHAAVFRSYPFNLAAPEAAAVAVTATRATADYFGALGASPAAGRLFLAGDFLEGAEPVAVLSETLWRSWGAGDPGWIGRHVRLDGQPHLVVGVLPAALAFPEDTQVWLPMDESRSLPDNRRSHLLTTLARLRPGVELGQAQAELATLGAALGEEAPEDDLRAFVATPLHQRLTASVRPALLALFGAVALLLLVACVNLAHLLLARGLARAREIAVRSALGAGRGRLARQLLVENLLLAGLAMVPAVALAFACTRVLLPLLPADVARLGDVVIDTGALSFALAASVLAVLGFGTAPILAATRLDLRSTLAEGTRGAGSRGRARGALIAAEVALVLVLTAAAGLLARTFLALQAVPLGFRTAGILSLYVSPGGERYASPQQSVSFIDDVLAGLQRLPGVEQAAASSALPTRALPWTSFGLEGGSGGVDAPGEPGADVVAVSPAYFRLLEIPLLRGRAFEERDAGDAPTVALLSRAAAEHFWPESDPLGRRVTLLHWDEPLVARVVGVVEDVRQRGPGEGIEPGVYFSHAQFADRVLGWHFLVRGAGEPDALAVPAQRVVRDVDAEQASTSVATLERTLAGAIAQRRFNALLVLAFAGAALVLVAAGIQGVVACVVTERTREIGVRMALGATPAEAVREMASHALRPAALGGLLGVAGALAAGRVLVGLLHGVAPADLPTLLASASLMIGVVGLAAWLPARRAAAVDPVIALRAE